MRRLVLWTVTSLLTGSLCISGTHAQDADDEFFPPGPGSGAVGSVDESPADTDDDLEDWWPAMVPDSPYEGPLGQVDNREPHDACENCFTIPDIFDYEIFESVPIQDGDSEFLIPREIPNPAPLAEGELPRPTVDDAGEPVWYIGSQGYSGPKDTDPISSQYGRSKIELLRIKARHEEHIMTIAGVHGFGIIATGFGVWLLPDYATVMVPETIEGVPVKVFVSSMPERRGHTNIRFRPVPVGARVTASAPGIALTTVGAGTLGPHIVRRVGSRYQLLSLTAAHVVRRDPTAPVPTQGTIPIYQPTVNIGNLFGHVRYLFRLRVCGTSVAACWRTGAPTNQSIMNPDIAAVEPTPFGSLVSSPFNTPTGTDPTRHLQNSASSYINGPSGFVRTATPGHTLKVWGAFTDPRVGQVTATGLTEVSRFRGRLYRDCCLTKMRVPVADGDSGAAVTYGGTGNRHIAGVMVLGSLTEGWFIPASHIKEAFTSASWTFSHYWGTKSGYRAPSTKTCDLPGGC